MYSIFYTKEAAKDSLKVKKSPFKKRVRLLLDLIGEDPFKVPPSYKKLLGDLQGAYSKRINRQHRLVYIVDEKLKKIVVLSLWDHYK